MNNILESVFKNIDFPINVWSVDGNYIKCEYSNNNLDGKKIIISEYTKNFPEKTKNLFDDFIRSNEGEMEINEITNNISLKFIGNNKILELILPKCGIEYVLSSISYKIRKPLTNIVGILPIIEEDTKNLEYLNIVKNSTAQIISVVNDIVDIIDIKQNRMVIKKESINVKEMVIDCLNTIKKEANKKKLNIFYKIDDDVPKIIYSDQDKIKQVLINILENSVRLTAFGSITLNISLNNEDDCGPFSYKKEKTPRCNLLFKIKDTGIGISDDKKKIINSILSIKKDTNIKTHKLTGFGLFICYNLLTLLDGHIWFKSEVDMGTIFYFNIVCEAFF